MDNQEAFNIVARHLLTQKCKSMKAYSSGLKYLYRGPNGTKCAIGCLIPDNEYNPDWDKSPINAKTLIDYGVVPSLRGIDRNFAAGLQSLHDNTDVIDWYDGLAIIAALYGLNSDILNEFP